MLMGTMSGGPTASDETMRAEVPKFAIKLMGFIGVGRTNRFDMPGCKVTCVGFMFGGIIAR